MTFCELREKDVINIHDCKRLGCVSDLVFESKKRLYLAVTYHHQRKALGFPGERKECEIPWCKIRQIGPDIILVDIDEKLHRQP